MIPKEFEKDINAEQLHTLKTLKTPGTGRILARWLVGLAFILFASLFLPWQQNIRGKGQVTAFAPANRPQSVESAIAGRIAEWKVMEGQYVKKGDTILVLNEIKDDYFDPQLLTRIDEQVEAKKMSLVSKKAKSEALKNQISALNNALKVKVAQANNKFLQARYKLASDSIDYEAEKVRYNNFENQYNRNKTLYEAGNIALTKFQEIESKYQEAKMKVVSAENKFLESKAELINMNVNIAGTEAEYRDKISKAESELNSTLSEIYESEADISKMKNYFSNIQIRSQQYKVVAPQNGYIVKAIKAGLGETIKEGEAVITIVPENPDLAVELYVQAMDIPLISAGHKARIEFDGWPAINFSGWPSISVGTFGGTVRIIDKVNSKNGMFRVLIVPDPGDEEWPDQVRMGSGAKGWVMLGDVSVWYEIWRQLNGFPPSLYESIENPQEEAAKVKKK